MNPMLTTLGNIPASSYNMIPEMYTNWIIHNFSADDTECIILIGHQTLLYLFVVNVFGYQMVYLKLSRIYIIIYIVSMSRSGVVLSCLLAVPPKKE